MEHVKFEETFSFNNITSHDRENTIERVDPKQVVAENVIPTKMIMETKDIPTVFLTKMTKKMIRYFLKL